MLNLSIFIRFMDSVIGSDNEAHTNGRRELSLSQQLLQHGLSFSRDFCDVHNHLSFAID